MKLPLLDTSEELEEIFKETFEKYERIDGIDSVSFMAEHGRTESWARGFMCNVSRRLLRNHIDISCSVSKTDITMRIFRL